MRTQCRVSRQVSIPNGHPQSFRPCSSVALPSSSILFQSLTGILSHLDISTTVATSGSNAFQSLTGILSHLDSWLKSLNSKRTWVFQSLTGILSHLDTICLKPVQRSGLKVSIPNGHPQSFRPRGEEIIVCLTGQFQSLTGILSHLDPSPRWYARATSKGFNP